MGQHSRWKRARRLQTGNQRRHNGPPQATESPFPVARLDSVALLMLAAITTRR